MQEYKRKYPLFSLCGLNCGLCPRYHTGGSSKCPGCGGTDFHLKHPACAVITCNKKHDNVEYCFQCTAFPCQRYSEPGKSDSFITYRNVIADFRKIENRGIDKYRTELNEKINFLEFLLKNYNDGRKKSFYCLAINLLDLSDLKSIKEEIAHTIENRDLSLKDKIKLIIDLFKIKAEQNNIDLKLRAP